MDTEVVSDLGKRPLVPSCDGNTILTNANTNFTTHTNF